MTHEQALNEILSHACGMHPEADVQAKGFQEYLIQTHCMSFVVQAKPLGEYRYEIIGVRKEW